MFRYGVMIARNIYKFPGLIGKMRKLTFLGNHSEEERYRYLQKVITMFQKTGYTKTEVYGEENLPEEGGYTMYSNHQGKYDAFGIVSMHKKPCTVVMDKAKSYAIFINEVIDLIKGKRLDKEDVKQGLMIINEVAEEVKRGKRYIIFPEGSYTKEKKNSLIDFKPGCFKVSLKSKTPIVPVTIIDSYKAWNTSSLKTVTTQVHFLKPICYEEYKGMKTQQIAEMVRERIREKIEEVTGTPCVG